MIPFEEIDKCLERLGKTRGWLAEASGRSGQSIRAALAPNAPTAKRSALIQKALTQAIEREEAAQAMAEQPLADGFQRLFMTDAQISRADMASRIIGSPSLIDFCKEAIEFRANEIVNFNRDPLDGLSPLKVVEEPALGKSFRSGQA